MIGKSSLRCLNWSPHNSFKIRPWWPRPGLWQENKSHAFCVCPCQLLHYKMMHTQFYKIKTNRPAKIVCEVQKLFPCRFCRWFLVFSAFSHSQNKIHVSCVVRLIIVCNLWWPAFARLRKLTQVFYIFFYYRVFHRVIS